MGVSPVRFNGQDLYKPGYYGKRNINKLNVGAASGSRMLIVGECTGGVPYNATSDFPNADDRVNWISNSSDLKSLINSGPAYDAALFALSPSNDPGVNGAPAVGIIRVNPAVKGTSIVKDVDTNNVLDISSRIYGLRANQIQYKILAGTSNGKKMQTKFEGNTIERDNIALDLFTVVYTGSSTGCALVLDPVGNLTLTTSGPSTPADDITLSLASYNTISSIVAYLNAHASGHYTAVLVGDGNFVSSNLDKIVSGDAVNVATVYTVAADLYAMYDYINNANDYLKCAYSSGYARRNPANMSSFVFLSSGSEGTTPSATEWGGSYDLAKMIDASFVLQASTDAAFAALLSAHVTYMNSVNGNNERQGGWGCTTTDNKSTKLAAIQAINNAAMGYFASVPKRYNESGSIQEYPGYCGMAAVMGMSAGNDITFAPTNKTLNCLGVKVKETITDVDDYIKGGAIIAQPSELGGIRIVRSVTTYQGSNIIANEWSVMRTILYITKDHRVYVQSLVGIAGDSTALESIKNRAELRIQHYEDQKYLIIDPAYNNSYRNFTFNVVGDVITISYEGTVVVPVNFILVNHNFTVIGFRG